jgi:hypothetical protein
VARIEGAHHGELLEPRHHARGRDLPARCHQRDLVARLHKEGPGQLAAEHDAEFTRHQLVERALLRGGGNVGDLGFELGHDAAHQRALHVFAARNERLRGNEGGGADDFGVLAGGCRDGVDVGQGLAVARKYFDVRHHAEHAVAHFLLEAVHYAEHDDQRRHPQCDAEHRHAGDEGDEAVAPCRPACARIAPAELQFIRKSHIFSYLTRFRRQRRFGAFHPRDCGIPGQ